jgi:hypothetical protein
MKTRFLIFSVVAAAILFSCNSKKKSEEIANYSYTEKSTQLSPELQKEIGPWLENDIICYGLVVTVNNEGTPLKGKPVKAKVVQIDGDEIKMKALEEVNIAEVKGCDKKGIAKGEIWMEKDKELFQTREDAINYLKNKNLLLE